MAQKYLGIDLGDHTVKVVVLNATLRGIQVEDRFEKTVVAVKDEDRLEASLAAAKALIRQRRLSQIPAGVVLPGGSGSYRRIEFPFADPKRIAQAVGFEVEDEFPIPLEELAYDHVTFPAKAKEKKGHALVVATRTSFINRVVEALQEVGVDLRLITLGAMANAQAMAYRVPPAIVLKEGECAVSLVVDMGHRTTELVAMTAKGPMVARTIRKGAGRLSQVLLRAYGFKSEAEAEAAKHSDAFLPMPGADLDTRQQEAAELVTGVIMPLAREIENTRQWLRAEYGLIVSEVCVSGGGGRLKGFVQWLAEEIGLPVVPVQPSAKVKLGADRDWHGHTIALGAALGAWQRPLIQLYTGHGGGTGDNRWLVEKMSTMAMLGVAVLAFAAVESLVKVRAVERERDAYVHELENESYTVFGEEMSSAEEVLARLEAVDEEDMSSQIPERGAFEILEALSGSGTPEGGRVAPVAPSPGGRPVAGMGAGQASSAASVAPEGVSETDAEASEEGDHVGILRDDDLIFSMVDIRPTKVDMKITASRATAQDRLASKLQSISCVGQVTKGKIRDRNERKEFEMNLDHQCYYAEKLELH